jgi:branched-chain amino acid transport system substrate-binding protein
MSTDALLLDRSFLRRAKPFSSTLRLTAAAQDPAQLPRARGRRFVRRYRERYRREPDPYAAYGYEAMALVLDLIDRAGDEAEDRTAIVDELFATTERDSVLGTYSIDELGNTTLDRIAGYRVRDGRPVFDAALRAP